MVILAFINTRVLSGRFKFNIPPNPSKISTKKLSIHCRLLTGVTCAGKGRWDMGHTGQVNKSEGTKARDEISATFYLFL